MINGYFIRAFRSRAKVAALSLCTLPFVAGCGDDGAGPDSVGVADLAGSWILTAWEYSKDSNPRVTEDLVVEDGLSGTLIVQEDGSFTFTRNAPDQPGSIETGTLEISGGRLTLDRAGESPITYSFDLDGNNVLTLVTDDVEWTFPGESRPVAASLRIELQRSS